MSELHHGDELFPAGVTPIGYRFSEDEGNLLLEIQTYEGGRVGLGIEGAISYRFTLSELYDGHLEDSWDKLLVLEKPAWSIRLADEESERGEFVRRRRFFHLDISDVGVLECYALAVRRTSQSNFP